MACLTISYVARHMSVNLISFVQIQYPLMLGACVAVLGACYIDNYVLSRKVLSALQLITNTGNQHSLVYMHVHAVQ